MNIIKLNAIGSTNDYLKALSKETQLEDGTVVITEDQTQGRGQMGAAWQFDVGKSLAFSMFKRFNEGVAIADQYWITTTVSLLLIECLEQFGIPQLSVKWPNDIMTGDKKLCGILVENQVQGSLVKATVVGIGLNVNNNSFVDLPKATSMKIAAGNEFDVQSVFETLAAKLWYGLQHPGSDWYEGKLLFEEQMYRKDKVSVFSAEGKQFNGIIRGIDMHGKLITEMEDEKFRSFGIKEIQLLN